MVLASTVILESHRSHDHILLFDGSGTLQTHYVLSRSIDKLQPTFCWHAFVIFNYVAIAVRSGWPAALVLTSVSTVPCDLLLDCLSLADLKCANIRTVEMLAVRNHTFSNCRYVDLKVGSHF
jgi:hypothetical protein